MLLGFCLFPPRFLRSIPSKVRLNSVKHSNPVPISLWLKKGCPHVCGSSLLKHNFFYQLCSPDLDAINIIWCFPLWYFSKQARSQIKTCHICCFTLISWASYQIREGNQSGVAWFALDRPAVHFSSVCYLTHLLKPINNLFNIVSLDNRWGECFGLQIPGERSLACFFPHHLNLSEHMKITDRPSSFCVTNIFLECLRMKELRLELTFCLESAKSVVGGITFYLMVYKN